LSLNNVTREPDWPFIHSSILGPADAHLNRHERNRSGRSKTNIPWAARLSWLENAYLRPSPTSFSGRFWPVK